MNKNKIIWVLVGLLVISLTTGAFFAGKYFESKNNSTETKEENKNSEDKKNSEEETKKTEPENDESKKEEPKKEEKEEMKTVNGYEHTLTYNSTSFEITGGNSNCATNYDKKYKETKNVSEGKIVNAKIMQGFLCGGSESGIIILDTGEVYETYFDCDGKFVFKKNELLKDYIIKDIEEVNFCPGCTINVACNYEAKVILKDGTKKSISIPIYN